MNRWWKSDSEYDHPMVVKARADVDDALARAENSRRAIEAVRHDWLMEHGGCVSCDNKGTIRYRPTLDYMNEYETMTCSSCEGRKPVEEPKFIDPTDPEAASRACAAYEAMKAAERAVSIERGKIVRVIKGRKVAKGTTWRVTTTGDGNYGPYCHLESLDRKQGATFVSLENVQVDVEASRAEEATRVVSYRVEFTEPDGQPSHYECQNRAHADREIADLRRRNCSDIVLLAGYHDSERMRLVFKAV